MAENDTPDVSQDSPSLGASPDVAGSSPAPDTVAPAGVSSSDVNQPSDQQTAPEPDPLEGVPSLEELQGKEGVPYAKALAQLRSAYEPLSAQHKELSTKFSVFEPVADRFQTAEEVQSLVSLNEKLNRYSPDETGALRPDTSEFVNQISSMDASRADDLTSRLIWGMTPNPENGQPIPRIVAALQAIRNSTDPADQQVRASLVRQLGGVEPSAVPAPVYYPTQAELDDIAIDPTRLTPEDRALQETFKRLPYEKRDVLAGLSPEYVRSELKKEQLIQQLTQERTQREESDRQAEIQATQRIEQEANAAGDEYVEQGFKGTLTDFAKTIYETYKPTDDPATNRKEGAQVVLSIVALSHPDTRWAGEVLLKEMGINPQDLEPLNKARESYATSGRQFGYLTHKKQPFTGERPEKFQQRLMVQAQNLATKIIADRNGYFTKRVQSHNANLDQTERARIPVGGGVAAAGTGSPNGRHRWADL